jgi:hypothetical protein
MERKLGASIQFFALMNGINLKGRVGLVNGPLRQEYRKGTTTFIPDFSAIANKPIVYPHLNRDDTGAFLVANSCDLYYNGVLMEFDSGTGLSTTGSMAGVFKRALKTLSIDGVSVSNIITFEIVNNLVPVSNFDNDTIKLVGLAEVNGQTINFDGLERTVEIVETVGQSTVLYLDGDTDITSSKQTATINAHVLVDGVSPSNLATAYDFKWYNISGGVATQIGTNSPTLVVAAADVSGTKTVRCDLFDKGSTTVKASKFINIVDYSDPYRVSLYVDGVNSNYLSEGQTAVVTCKVEETEGGAEVTSARVSFVTTDNSGNLIEALSGEKESKSISVTNAAVVAAGGSVSIYASVIAIV